MQFSAAEKQEIAGMLDDLGVGLVKGGWPGANPTDGEFLDAPPVLRAMLTAFGMTRRAGRSAGNDDMLAAVLDAGTASVCLVGKTHQFHVRAPLGMTLKENRAAIAHVVARGGEPILDAEHFFDGHADDPGYALDCLRAALDAGARWVVLCDTNGGTMPGRIGAVAAEVIAAGVPGHRLGIHTHDDTEQAVAGALAAVEAGARQVQGTLNGRGERCGNANLVSLIPTLLLKAPCAERFEIGVSVDALPRPMAVSRRRDDILNRVPRREAPYVGASAVAHKAGLHASAIEKDLSTYEHVPPEAVGILRTVPLRNHAGLSNLRRRLGELGLTGSDPQMRAILARVTAREDEDCADDTAAASFELIARAKLGSMPRFFETERYRVTVERRAGRCCRRPSWCCASTARRDFRRSRAAMRRARTAGRWTPWRRRRPRISSRRRTAWPTWR